jgi:hypothetical protein
LIVKVVGYGPRGATKNLQMMVSRFGLDYDPVATFAIRGAGNDSTTASTISIGSSANYVYSGVDNAGGNPVSGVFAGLPEGTVFAVNGTPLRISYVGGTGNDVTLTVVSAVPTLTVTTASLPGGRVGTPYVAALVASGGTPPYTWSLATGSLPPGVALNATTGALNGTPSTPGTYPSSVTVTDSAAGSVRAIAPKAVATAPFTIVVAAAASELPRYEKQISAPCAARRSAMALPMPREPPVMMAALPVRSIMRRV